MSLCRGLHRWPFNYCLVLNATDVHLVASVASITAALRGCSNSASGLVSPDLVAVRAAVFVLQGFGDTSTHGIAVELNPTNPAGCDEVVGLQLVATVATAGHLGRGEHHHNHTFRVHHVFSVLEFAGRVLSRGRGLLSCNRLNPLKMLTVDSIRGSSQYT